MPSLLDQITLADIQQDIVRNVVAWRVAGDLYDDLSSDPADCLLAQKIEQQVKPSPYQSKQPIIDGPFEDAMWFNAIQWPFKNWRHSRFSDGSFGVWYGSDAIETTVYESSYHWYRGLVSDAGFEKEPIIAERSVYSVRCSASLIDFRRLVHRCPDIAHRTDYRFCQTIGARIRTEGHPGLITISVRRTVGENVAIFNPIVLSNPQWLCQLAYLLQPGSIEVQKEPGKAWLTLPISEMA